MVQSKRAVCSQRMQDFLSVFHPQKWYYGTNKTIFFCWVSTIVIFLKKIKINNWTHRPNKTKLTANNARIQNTNTQNGRKKRKQVQT